MQLAQHTPDLSILVEAVSAAGLVDALNGEQRLTVFAPTNEAFAALLQQLGVTKEELLASKELLTQVLLHHVVAGDVLSGQVVTSAGLTTLAGTTLTPEAAGTRSRTPAEWALLGVGVLATLALSFGLARLARRQLAMRLETPTRDSAPALATP